MLVMDLGSCGGCALPWVTGDVQVSNSGTFVGK